MLIATFVFFLVPISPCDGFVVSIYLSWEWHCLRVPLIQLCPGGVENSYFSSLLVNWMGEWI